VVVLGSGAFACEAMEAAIANNAQHVTMICRDRKRYKFLPLTPSLKGSVSCASLQRQLVCPFMICVSPLKTGPHSPCITPSYIQAQVQE
jgi:hypothetical protein